VPVPGAAAFLSALVASGLPTDSFRFAGFLPAKAGARRTALEAIRDSALTQVFYEAPHRLLECLRDLVAVLGGERQVVVARELTKVHEEFLRGRADSVLRELETRKEIKGEITLLIGKADERPPASAGAKTIAQRMQELQRDNVEEKAALKQVAREFGLSRSEAYREWQRAKR
jgi:16S rRNA (cytidine1402-2'-O)-methyltransferase